MTSRELHIITRIIQNRQREIADDARKMLKINRQDMVDTAKESYYELETILNKIKNQKQWEQ